MWVSDKLLSQKIIQNLQPNTEIWLVYVMPRHGFRARMQRGASAYFTVNMSGKNIISRRRDRVWLLQVHRIQVDSCNSKKIWWAWTCYNISVITYTKLCAPTCRIYGLNQLQHKKRWKSRSGGMWPFSLLEFYMWKNPIDVDTSTQRATWKQWVWRHYCSHTSNRNYFLSSMIL